MSADTCKTARDRAFIDTNVMVYALFPDTEHHAPSRRLLDRIQAENGDLELCVTPQVLAEFFAVVTNRRRVADPRAPEEALEAIEKLLAMPGLTLLSLPIDVVAGWIDLVRRTPVKGGEVFDLQIIAAMLAHDIKTIYTFNTPDFNRFAEIEALMP